MIKSEIAHALTITDIKERYEYVYDVICDYLDNKFKENNYCDFRDDNKCFVNREKLGVNTEMGCCYSFYLDMFLNMRDKKLCQYVGDKCCMVRCITCKLYTCKHLEKRGISFNIYNFQGIKKIFTKKQIRVLKFNAFRTKDEIINRLIEVRKSKIPYFIFCLFYKERVRSDNKLTTAQK